MESHLLEWLNLLLRWSHFIVGVAWIGASFYFNFLENNLDRRRGDDTVAGELWAIHGGGFYHLKKLTPAELPSALHWFKWEAYTTWLTGVALLAVVYYWNAKVFLLDLDASLTVPAAVTIAAASVAGSWFVYDGLCRWLKRSPKLLTGGVLVFLTTLAWAFAEIFSGRAAFIHTGAAIGTMMVGNVFFVIIPAQKEMVTAVAAGRAPDAGLGAAGLLRSRHNNYLTLPVLFIMLSAHYPSVHGHGWNWLALAVVALAGVVARHYFNVRKRTPAAAWWLAAAAALVAAAAAMTMPAARTPTTAAVTTDTVVPVIQARCTTCHAAAPTQPGFAAPPAGVVLESAADIERHAAQIATATASGTMPVGNLTGMTDAERALVAAWWHTRRR